MFVTCLLDSDGEEAIYNNRRGVAQSNSTKLKHAWCISFATNFMHFAAANLCQVNFDQVKSYMVVYILVVVLDASSC
jgi:hypothetical protein